VLRLKRLTKGKTGFTLLEVVLALVIFGLVLLPLALTFALGVNVAAGASLMNQATAVAEGSMENLRSQGFTALTDPALYKNEWADGPFNVQVQTAYHKGPNRLLVVTVEVTWENRGKPQSLVLESFIGPE
jgi:prepilin-type N-terminal cleavage/methylation domain-containing protein